MVSIKYYYIILYFVTLHTCFIAALECDENEIEENCPAFCKSYYCPRSEAETHERTCETPATCPEPSCKSACRFNYRRNENQTCIPTRDCPPFECSEPNQEYNPCPPYCPTDDCSEATPDGRCPRIGRIGIVLECFPACRCIKGYWKKNGVCVPYTECGRTDSTDSNLEETPKENKSIAVSIAELNYAYFGRR